MKNIVRFIAVLTILLAISVVADYIVTGQPPCNAVRIQSMKIEFKPRLWTVVKSQNLVVTNAVRYTSDPLYTNIVSTSSYQVVAYVSPTEENHLNTAETMTCSMLTVGQLGLTTNSTATQVIDAMIRAGMVYKGLIATNGTLL